MGYGFQMVSAISLWISWNAVPMSKSRKSCPRQLRHTFLPHQLGRLPGTLLGLLPSKIPWPIRAEVSGAPLTHGQILWHIVTCRGKMRIAKICENLCFDSWSPDCVNDHPHRHSRRSVLSKLLHSTDPVQMNHPHINPPMPVKHGWMYLSRWFDTFEIGNLLKHMVIIPRIAEFPSHGLTTFDTFEIYWW